MIAKRLPPDVYNRAITFLYGTLDDINARLRRECPDEFEELRVSLLGHYKMYIHSGGYEADYLCVVRTGTRDEQFAVLTHEAFHLVGHALRNAGIPLTEDTEEAYTYYLQWITRHCLRMMKG
jgi:hypothetical protein